MVVKGTARVLEKQAEIFAAEAIGLRSWIPTVKTVFVRIVPTEVTGRRFQFGQNPRLTRISPRVPHAGPSTLWCEGPPA